MRAIWNGVVVAESDQVVALEGNYYFPSSSIRKQYFEESTHHSVCGWKGTASYFDIVVGGERNDHGAWYYPEVSEAAKEIKGMIGFWKGVEVAE